MSVIFSMHYDDLKPTRGTLYRALFRPLPALLVFLGVVLPAIALGPSVFSSMDGVARVLFFGPLSLGKVQALLVTWIVTVAVVLLVMSPLHETLHCLTARALGYAAWFLPPWRTLRQMGSFAVAFAGDMPALHALLFDLAPIVLLTALPLGLSLLLPHGYAGTLTMALLSCALHTVAFGNVVGSLADVILAGLVLERARTRRVKAVGDLYTIYDP